MSNKKYKEFKTLEETIPNTIDWIVRCGKCSHNMRLFSSNYILDGWSIYHLECPNCSTKVTLKLKLL